MSQRSRLVLGLCGALAATAAPSAFAQSAFSHPPEVAAAPQPGQSEPVYYQQQAPAPAQVAPAKHTHKGLFGWRHCVECQRARVRARDGVNVPPPQSQSRIVLQDGAVIEGPITISDPNTGSYTIIEPNGTAAPGYAVAGGPAEGYAVAGGPAAGAEPMPVGVSRGARAAWNGSRVASMPARRPGMGPYDPSVRQSSLTPAQTAMSGPGHNRPHIISHTLGFGGLFSRYRHMRDDQRRSVHASIAYGNADDKVVELPASAVYGR